MVANDTPQKPLVRGLLWTVRILLVFALLAALLVLLYRLGYDVYKDVAEWAEPGNHDSIVYDGETYHLAGVMGKKGLTKSKFPQDKIIGQVRDDGVPAITEPVTTAEPETEEPSLDPEDTEPPEETDPPVESVALPAGAELFEKEKHTYVLYSVKDKEEFLLVLMEDGNFYVFYREGTENPLEKAK